MEHLHQESDRELLRSVKEYTEKIHKTFTRINPFTIGDGEVRRAMQEILDSVRSLSIDVRVALRNYDIVFAQNQELKRRVLELEDKLKEQ